MVPTSEERLSLEIAKKTNQAQTPALGQVLYFSEVTAKRRETARRDRQSQREQGDGRKGTVNHWSSKSQEASAQGKKESWRMVRGHGERLVPFVYQSSRKAAAVSHRIK